VTGATGPTGATGADGTTVTSGSTSHSAAITVPAASRTLAPTDSNSCDGTPQNCMAHLADLGTVTTTISGFTGCTSAGTEKLIVTPRNLPANALLQNAVCNGTGTASVTLVNATTDGTVNVPTSTVFQFLLIP
jgi:hypothetical protein